MRKLHRAVALLLTLMMVLSVLPLGAAALTVPDDQELIYFADCGADTFPSEIQTMIENSTTVENAETPDQAYDGTWGYTNSKATKTWANGTTSEEIYDTFRAFPEEIRGETMSYKFAVDAGTYTVTVGLYDPWGVQNRKSVVSVNGGEGQEYSYANGAGTVVISDVVLSAAGDLTVNIAPDNPDTGDQNRDALVSFIMVTREVEEPDPEPTVPEAPNPQTPIWGSNGRNFALYVHYICDNEDAAHKGGNDVLEKKNFITAGEYFTFGAVTEQNGVYEVTATVNANKLLEDKFGVVHTVAGTTTLTLEYLEASKKWAIKSDSDVYELTLTGTCTVGGPEAPSTKNCSNFFVTVYGAVPQLDGSVDNKSVSSSRWDIAMNHDVEITFSTPAFVDGVWTCNATVHRGSD